MIWKVKNQHLGMSFIIFWLFPTPVCAHWTSHAIADYSPFLCVVGNRDPQRIAFTGVSPSSQPGLCLIRLCCKLRWMWPNSSTAPVALHSPCIYWTVLSMCSSNSSINTSDQWRNMCQLFSGLNKMRENAKMTCTALGASFLCWSEESELFNLNANIFLFLFFCCICWIDTFESVRSPQP